MLNPKKMAQMSSARHGNDTCMAYFCFCYPFYFPQNILIPVTPSEVAEWLRLNKLGHLALTLFALKIDGWQLRGLTKEDVATIGFETQDATRLNALLDSHRQTIMGSK